MMALMSTSSGAHCSLQADASASRVAGVSTLLNPTQR